MQLIQDSLGGLKLGSPQVHLNLAPFPLVGEGKKVVIPVSCVEQGRWSYRSRDFGTAHRTLFAKARAKKMDRVSESLRERGDRFANQSEIWEDVAEKTATLGRASPTMAMGDTSTPRPSAPPPPRASPPSARARTSASRARASPAGR